jgi:glucokinase
MNIVGVDVGATKIAAGVISTEGKVLGRVRYPTAKTPEKLLSGIVRVVSEVRDGFEVEAVCVAVPGLLLSQESMVVYSPNLHAIEGIRLKDELQPQIELPLTVENDNSAAAWGEFRFGAGKGTNYLVFIGIGTGIGGGIVIQGQLVRGAQGAAGELGHVTIQATGPRCACGNRGCLEAFASGTAIGRRAREVAREKPNSALGLLAAEREVLGEDVTRLALAGDRGRALGVEGGSSLARHRPRRVRQRLQPGGSGGWRRGDGRADSC